MSRWVIKAENVSKKFCKDLYKSMLYGITDIFTEATGINSDTASLRKYEFWAVNNISFELKKGEILGIIGSNGSGKTTILKMLNGIFMPDDGRIEVKGKVSTLVEIGAGFHPMLTGRENVYVNGAILGMGKREINGKFDSIVDFAGIGEFLNSPVKYYSSGMYVRLGFAIAVHCDPDILLVDEVLAVGDLNFRRKCANKMEELRKTGASIVFVTHDMGSLKSMCGRAICLRSGKIMYMGDIDGAVSEYMFTPIENSHSVDLRGGTHKIKDIFIEDRDGKRVDELFTGEFYRFIVNIEVDRKIDFPVVGIAIYDSAGNMVIGANTKTSGFGIEYIDGKAAVSLEFPFLNMIPGHYRARIALHDRFMGIIDDITDGIFFRVKSNDYVSGSIFSCHKWNISHE